MGLSSSGWLGEGASRHRGGRVLSRRGCGWYGGRGCWPVFELLPCRELAGHARLCRGAAPLLGAAALWPSSLLLGSRCFLYSSRYCICSSRYCIYSLSLPPAVAVTVPSRSRSRLVLLLILARGRAAGAPGVRPDATRIALHHARAYRDRSNAPLFSHLLITSETSRRPMIL